MKAKIPVFLVLGLLLLPLAFGETQAQQKPQAQGATPNPVATITEAMAGRLGQNLNVKHIVGQPVKVGQVTLIPVMMIDFGFGGGGGGNPAVPQAGGQGFYMSGEARPLGFVVISKSGTQFIPVGKVPRK